MKKHLYLLLCIAIIAAACSKSDGGDDNREVPVTSVQLSLTSATIMVEGAQQLYVTLSPANATNTRVTWSSSNTAVATVSSTGLVTAISEGTATITAAAGSVSARCTVTVTKKEVEVTSVALNKTSLTLDVGASEALSATVYPTNATDKTVAWGTSSTAVATVSINGVVTAVSVGTANIMAFAGGKSATCQVTVRIVPVASVMLNKTTLALNKGDSETLTATVSPEDATDKTVRWHSSNTAVATVGGNGAVSAVGVGTAFITATAGDKSATCEVTVSIPVVSITLNKIAVALYKGYNETLTATVLPENATDKTIVWSTSNAAVATVSEEGVVAAINSGSAIITATAGNKRAICTVTVYNPNTLDDRDEENF